MKDYKILLAVAAGSADEINGPVKQILDISPKAKEG
jgi:hypothetical protein